MKLRYTQSFFKKGDQVVTYERDSELVVYRALWDNNTKTLRWTWVSTLPLPRDEWGDRKLLAQRVVEFAKAKRYKVYFPAHDRGRVPTEEQFVLDALGR